MEEKQEQLFSILRDLGQVIVAYSGGTDSAYLAWAALYCVLYSAVAMLLALILFEDRDLA